MDPTQPFPLAPPVRVDPAAIERGLERFWESADQAPALGGAASVVRSCTLNFAVVLSDDDQPTRIVDTIAPVTLLHPCRIFLVAAQPHAPSEALQASVSALCHLPAPGQPHICSEQITLEATGRAVDGLPHLLLALLVPDLPLTVWWRGRPPLGTPLFAALNAIADRAVIDTHELGASVLDLALVAELADHDRPAALADLTWSRLTPWRTLTAQCFDSPQQQEYLKLLDRVRVQIGGDAITSEALLWVGWLASRLGWTLRSGEIDGGEARYTFDAPHPVQVKIDCTGDGEVGALCAIELVAGGVPAVRYAVAACAERTVRATVEQQGTARVDRIVPMAQRAPAALLSDEFDLVGRDRIYEAALRVASQMAVQARRV